MENKFSSRIRELRTSLKLTQSAFAESVGTSQNALSGYENKDRIPSFDILMNIATTYNISLDWLCGLSEHKSLSTRPQTMGDILRMLFSLKDSTYFEIFFHEENVDISLDDPTPYYQSVYLNEIGFINQILNNYIGEWHKILRLYKEGTVDEEVYSLWIEKTLRKADTYTPLGISLTSNTVSNEQTTE